MDVLILLRVTHVPNFFPLSNDLISLDQNVTESMKCTITLNRTWFTRLPSFNSKGLYEYTTNIPQVAVFASPCDIFCPFSNVKILEVFLNAKEAQHYLQPWNICYETITSLLGNVDHSGGEPLLCYTDVHVHFNNPVSVLLNCCMKVNVTAFCNLHDNEKFTAIGI